MRWIREHKFIFIVILCVVLALGAFVISLIFHDKNDDGSIVNDANSHVQNSLYGFKMRVSDTMHAIFRFKDLQSQLEELEDENLELKKELNEALLEREELEKLEDLSRALDFEYTKKKFDMVSGSVSSYDGANFTTTFTIDIGSDEGVEAGMPVVNGDGLIGKISQVGPNWAKVTSLTDDSSKISFKVVRDRSQLGVCEGTPKGDLTGFMMDADANIQVGDIIITSGMVSYPAGLEIGTVTKVEYNTSTLLRELEIEPCCDFDRIDKVCVLKENIIKEDTEETENTEVTE